MSKRNENRPGYKKTKVGWIPGEWQVKKLDGLVEIVSGNSPSVYKPSSTGKYPFIKVDDLNLSDKVQVTAREFSDENISVVPKDSIIFAKRGAAIATNKIRITGFASVMDSNMMALIPVKIQSEFLYYEILFQKLWKIADTSSIPQINNKHIRPYKIPLPEINEQNNIIKVLCVWDRAIEQTRKLIDAKKRLKQGLMQQLLTGRMRFPEFGKPAERLGELPEGWRRAKLSSLFNRIERPVKTDVKNILSITARVGFVDQREKFNKVIAGKNLENYVLLKKGEFSYNKGNSKAYPQGCIYRLEEFEEGAVPNVYYSFAPFSDSVSSDFYKHYFEHGSLNQQLSALINKGVRNDGLLNLSAHDFFRVKVLVPPIEEQTKIASVLTCLSKKIVSLVQKESALINQKQGLMQKLLTGEIRVKYLGE